MIIVYAIAIAFVGLVVYEYAKYSKKFTDII